MKKNILIPVLLLIIISLMLTSCFDWKYDISYEGIKFDKVRLENIKDKPVESPIVIGILSAPTKIFGYPCAADWVHISKNELLLLFKVSENTKILNVDIPKNSWVRFKQEGGFICTFPNDTTIQGYKCEGGGGSKGVQVSFYDNGKLNFFYSELNTIIDGIKCQGNPYIGIHIIGLHKNGKLKRCDLAEESKINGKMYKKGHRIIFDVNGLVIK